MNSFNRLAAAAILMAGTLGVAGTAYAATETPVEKAELAQLSPQVRSKVEARLKQGETVHGVLETMLLNDVSQDFASGKVVASDFSRGEIVVANKDGQMKAFPFDVTMLTVKK